MIWQIIVANAWRVQIMQDDDDLVIGCNFYLSAISSTTDHGLLNIWHKWWAKIFVINTDILLYSWYKYIIFRKPYTLNKFHLDEIYCLIPKILPIAKQLQQDIIFNALYFLVSLFLGQISHWSCYMRYFDITIGTFISFLSQMISLFYGVE